MNTSKHYLRIGLYLIGSAIMLIILAALLTSCTGSPGHRGQTWTCFEGTGICLWLPDWFANAFECINCR